MAHKPMSYKELSRKYTFGDCVGIFIVVELFFLLIGLFFMVNLEAETNITIDWKWWFLSVPIALVTAFNVRRNHNKFAANVRNGNYTSYVNYPLRGRSRADFPIIGPSHFVATVNRVLNELEQKAPEHYREAIEYLEKAVYVPHRLSEFAARSDGLFAIDGSEYALFRFVFLHEVGHRVRGLGSARDRSEKAANDYADMVSKKL